MKKILLKHTGNMGDAIFLIPPIAAGLKKKYPDSHITLITAWGYKESKWKLTATGIKKYEQWGNRNQGGHEIHLLMTNPHIDQLVHYHSTKTALDNSICHEDGQTFPTWSEQYYRDQIQSGTYDEHYELDVGLTTHDNPIEKLLQLTNLPPNVSTNYRMYFTPQDEAVAKEAMQNLPHPRIVLLESIGGPTTRNWDPAKVSQLESAIQDTYGVPPIWFGGAHQHYHHGQPLTLRQNIATLKHADVGIGVLSGPLHFAAAAGLPTITLYCDQPLHRAAPAHFLNPSITDKAKQHRTVLGPSPEPMHLLKNDTEVPGLTPVEQRQQNFSSWQNPGRQATKSCLAVITVDEIMAALNDTVAPNP